ncbi:kinase-like domain-containing protein [Xylaria grammica]|nr:kinase-like domain-containing protein [Xylaria grammica]
MTSTQTHHPLALFSLVPSNVRAWEVLNDPHNSHLLSTLSDGTLALDVGHVVSVSGNPTTLATIGRNNADIIVMGGSISRAQCSFELDPDSNIVMFYDRSNNWSTQVFGSDSTPFEYGRLRRVMVNGKINKTIGMGGERKDLVRFDLRWHYDPIGAIEKVRDRKNDELEKNPHLVGTIDMVDTAMPTRMGTRLHTRGPQEPLIRYNRLGELGAGTFGIVLKAANVDTGKLMAVKRLKRPSNEADKMRLATILKREVETLSRLSHPHIVNYIAFQNTESDFEIFMGLKQGTLQSFIENDGAPLPNNVIGEMVFHQMLQAIDFLAVQNIIHRDIKPENILYETQGSRYCFQLGDFGLCNVASSARTYVGSPLYIAPEIAEGGAQTHKVDVWSLFVTILWTLDVGEFRQRSYGFRSGQSVRQEIVALSRDPGIQAIEAMARENPEERATAAQMLVKCFNGQGLSTLRHRIPEIVTPQPRTKAQATRTGTNTPRRPLIPRNLIRRTIPQDNRHRITKPQGSERRLTPKGIGRVLHECDDFRARLGANSPGPSDEYQSE